MEITQKIRAYSKRLEIKFLICSLFLFHFLLVADASAKNQRSHSLPLVFDEQNDFEIIPTARWATAPTTGTFMYLTYAGALPTATVGNAPVKFDTQNAVQGNITYDATTGTVQLINTGYYRVAYGVLLPGTFYVLFKPQLNGSFINVANLFNYPVLGLSNQGPTDPGLDQGDFIFQSTTPNATFQIINTDPATINVYGGSYLIIEQIQ
ncbi:MAG: hypothetical protein V4492_09385 [Chlamydiota bacterium]